MLETKHIRDLSVGRMRFSVSSRGGRMHIRSIHPYDEAEYCWGYTTDKDSWVVMRVDKQLAIIKGTDEDAAKAMAELDKDVKPLICIY